MKLNRFKSALLGVLIGSHLAKILFGASNDAVILAIITLGSLAYIFTYKK